MTETEKSYSEDTTDLSYIEISLQDLKNLKNAKYCPSNKDLEPKYITTKNVTSYPYPPWLPHKEILKHKIRKSETNCIKTTVERKKVNKIKCQENSEIKPNLEKSAEQVNPAWTRLLKLLAYSCFKNRNKAIGSTRNFKFMASPLRHCFVTMHYEQAPRTPVPGWEPRQRVRRISPPRFH